MDRLYFYSGLAMVIAVNFGHVWELLGLSCLCWHLFGICQVAGWGVEARPPRDDNFRLATHSMRRGQGGGVAGAEPPHKGGPNRPDRPKNRRLRREKTSLASSGVAH